MRCHGYQKPPSVLKPVVARYQASGERIAFRGDAAFAQTSMYDYLESAGIEYAIRLPANQILQARITDLLKRPVGRPPHDVQRFYRSFRYMAKSWSHPRGVVAKVEWHPGERFPRVGFIITNLAVSGKSVVAFYNQRGTAQQWIKEGKGAIKWTRLSCRSFKANAVRLQLHALAYNLGNFLRTLATPEAIAHWSLTSLREKLIKIGAKVVSHGRYITFQMAEVGSHVRSLLQSCCASLRCDHRRWHWEHERPGETTSWEERREICALTTVPQPRFPAARPLGAPIQPNRSSGPPAGVSPPGIGRRLLEKESHMGNPR